MFDMTWGGQDLLELQLSHRDNGTVVSKHNGAAGCRALI
jgi:hypothetical protein